MGFLYDTQADKDEQVRITLALNNAIPTPCSYRNLTIALAHLLSEVTRLHHDEPDEHAQAPEADA